MPLRPFLSCPRIHTFSQPKVCDKQKTEAQVQAARTSSVSQEAHNDVVATIALMQPQPGMEADKRTGGVDDGMEEARQEKGDSIEVPLLLRVERRNEPLEVRVRADKVDLSEHTGLVELPEGLRKLKHTVRELKVVSTALKALPE